MSAYFVRKASLRARLFRRFRLLRSKTRFVRGSLKLLLRLFLRLWLSFRRRISLHDVRECLFVIGGDRLEGGQLPEGHELPAQGILIGRGHAFTEAADRVSVNRARAISHHARWKDLRDQNGLELFEPSRLPPLVAFQDYVVHHGRLNFVFVDFVESVLGIGRRRNLGEELLGLVSFFPAVFVEKQPAVFAGTAG